MGTDIARFFLTFSHDTIIVPLMILGYIWIDRKFFLNAIYLILVGMLVNVALKVSFQVPLAPHLNKTGFAFPSGHMQTSVVVYGWLLVKVKNPFYKIPFILLLMGIGWALVQCGYHNYGDVCGAVLVGVLLIVGYHFLVKLNRKVFHLLLLLLSTGLMGYIAMMHELSETQHMAYWTLMGLMGGERIFNSQEIPLTMQRKIMATLLCFGLLFLLKTLFDYLPAGMYRTPLQSFFIGISLPFSVYVGEKIDKHYRRLC